MQLLHWQPARSEWLIKFRNCDNKVEDLAAEGVGTGYKVLKPRSFQLYSEVRKVNRPFPWISGFPVKTYESKEDELTIESIKTRQVYAPKNRKMLIRKINV